MAIWLLKGLAYTIVYLFLFIVGIKFYLWSRKQQKKYQGKWGRRFGLIFFFAPVILFLAHLCLPIPQEWMKVLQFLVDIIDASLAWFKQVLEPVLGFGYYLLKPILSAFIYAAAGFGLGSILDAMQGSKPKETKDAKQTKRATNGK
jgi:uncharacterized membrane protein